MNSSSDTIFTQIRDGNWDIIDDYLHVDGDPDIQDPVNDQTLLHYTAQAGKIVLVRRLLACHCHPSRLSHTGQTPLHLAAIGNYPDIIEALITAGAAVDIYDRNGLSPLHEAARQGNPEALKAILNHDADVNLKTKSEPSTSALHLAIEGGNVKCIQLLLKAGARKNTSSNDTPRPLTAALEQGKYEIATVLHQAGATLNLNPLELYHLLVTAIHNRNLTWVQYLVERTDCEYETLGLDQLMFYQAAKEGGLDILKYMVRYGWNPSWKTANQETLLHAAATSGDIETMDYLINECNLKFNVVNKFGMTPLHTAVINGYWSLIKYALDKNITPRELDDSIRQLKSYSTFVHAAVLSNDLQILDYVIRLGFDVNRKDSEGRTPLFQAVERGYFQAVERLVNASADVNIADNNLVTPLMACENDLFDHPDRYHIVKLPYTMSQEDLTQQDVELYGPDDSCIQDHSSSGTHTSPQGDDDGPIGILPDPAYRRRKKQIFDYLVQCGARLDAVAKDGTTIVHLAAGANNVERLQQLIDMGMDINAKTFMCYTPLSFAICAHANQAFDLLIKAGTDTSIRDRKNNTFLHQAGTIYNQYAFNRLVELGLDTKAQNNTRAIPALKKPNDNAVPWLFRMSKSGLIIDYMLEKDRRPFQHRTFTSIDELAYLPILFPMPDVNGTIVCRKTTQAVTELPQSDQELYQRLKERDRQIQDEAAAQQQAEAHAKTAQQIAVVRATAGIRADAQSTGQPDSNRETNPNTAPATGKLIPQGKGRKSRRDRKNDQNPRRSKAANPPLGQTNDNPTSVSPGVNAMDTASESVEPESATPDNVFTTEPAAPDSTFTTESAAPDSTCTTESAESDSTFTTEPAAPDRAFTTESADSDSESDSGGTPSPADYEIFKPGPFFVFGEDFMLDSDSVLAKYRRHEYVCLPRSVRDEEISSIVHKKKRVSRELFQEVMSLIQNQGKKLNQPTDQATKELMMFSVSSIVAIDRLAKAAGETDKAPGIHKACETGLADRIIELLEQGVNPNLPDHNGRYPLEILIWAYDSAVDTAPILRAIEKLLEKGADVNRMSPVNYSPLHLACIIGSWDLFNLMLQYGGDIHRQCWVYTDPYNLPQQKHLLHSAVMGKNPKIVQYLLENGVPVNQIDQNGDQPLHLISYHDSNHSGCIKDRIKLMPNNETLYYGDLLYSNEDLSAVFHLLVKHGADINAQNDHGDTPLMKSAQVNDTLIMYDFAEAHCDPTIQNKDRKDVHQIALDNDNVLMIRLVERILFPEYYQRLEAEKKTDH